MTDAVVISVAQRERDTAAAWKAARNRVKPPLGPDIYRTDEPFIGREDEVAETGVGTLVNAPLDNLDGD